jgi:NAD(P)-dependent dehydrogenase (short-subunit alcohol dehydrogenase family)
MATTNTTRVALVNGGSAGLGLALTRALAGAGWHVITDGRSAEKVKEAEVPDGVTTIVGDLTDADHREDLRIEVERHGRLDLLVHNASTLGPLPMKRLEDVDVADLQQVWRTNIGGPLVLTSTMLPWLRDADGVLVSISSDAAVNHYEGWASTAPARRHSTT